MNLLASTEHCATPNLKPSAAAELARNGFSIIPLYYARQDGSCSCAKGTTCPSAGKHPRFSEWQTLAMTPATPEQIAAHWAQSPDDNLGYAIGAGVLIIDYDPRNDADGTGRTLFESLPGNTLRVRTGSGGEHRYFLCNPNHQFPAKLQSHPAIDLKGLGGQVVLPPSISGKGSYEWLTNLPLAPLPEWVADFGRDRGMRSTREHVNESDFDLNTVDQSPRVIGKRNLMALALQSHLITQGKRDNVALALGGLLKNEGWQPADAYWCVHDAMARAGSADPVARAMTAIKAWGVENAAGYRALVDLVDDTTAKFLGAVAKDPYREGASLDRWKAERVARGARDIAAIGMYPTAVANDALPRLRTQIFHEASRLADSVDKAIEILAAADVYQRCGLLVQVTRDLAPDAVIKRSKDSPRIAEMRPATIKERLARHSDWRTETMTGFKSIGVPADVVAAVHERGEWAGVKRLDGLAEFPIVRPDGTIVNAEGYDQITRVYVSPCRVESFTGASQNELARFLTEELISDFPLADETHKSAWLSALITPLARYAFEGPAPLILIDKNVRGSGGSLLADVIGVVCTGRPLPRMSQETDDDEEKKRLLALSLAGDSIALLDNVNRPLGNGELDKALTSQALKGRLLGKNEIITAPWKCLVVATGNNIQLIGDTTRRALHVRLDSNEENPETRTGFRHADLLGWVRENRPVLLGAALEIVAARLRSPRAKVKPWGSFEGWSEVVRGAVLDCALPDPYESRRELVAIDSDAETARALIEALAEMGATSEKDAKPLAAIVQAAAQQPASPLYEALTAIDPKLDRKTITSAFIRYRGRVISSRKLQGTDRRKSGNIVKWFVG